MARGSLILTSLKKCMNGMLNLPGQCPINISLDTLDECSDLMGMLSAHEEVLKLIEEPVNLKLSILKCTFPWASQPEMDI